MVKSPQQVLKSCVSRDQPKVEALEARIDAALERDFDGKNQIAISKGPGLPSKPALDQLMASYRRAGWQVREVYDQRDGDYFEFKASQRTTNSSLGHQISMVESGNCRPYN